MNKIVKAVINRPMGSYHPKHEDIYYSVNYGYAPIKRVAMPQLGSSLQYGTFHL